MARFRLFRRDSGKWNFYSSVPKLSLASQDGYEVTASSQYNNEHALQFAFDGDLNTQWASSGEGENAVTAAEATITNIIGSSKADGTYTGLYSFLAAKSKLGVAPRILYAPGFSVTEVISEMLSIAERLRAVVIADCPDANNEELIKFVTACASARVYAVYPEVINTKNETVPASPYVAGVIARTDNEQGFWVSPSNKTINGIIGLNKPIDFSLGDSACRANYLNEKNIATIINQNGYKIWGNRSTVTEDAYKFYV